MLSNYRKWFRILFISPCVTWTFFGMVMLFVGIEVASYAGTSYIKAEVSKLVSIHAAADNAQSLRICLYTMRLNEKDTFLHGANPNDVKKYKAKWNEAWKRFNDHYTALSYAQESQEVKLKYLPNIQAYLYGYDSISDGMMKSKNVTNEHVSELMDEYVVSIGKVDAAIEEYYTSMNGLKDKEIIRVIDLITVTRRIVVIAAGVISLLVVIMTSVIIESIIKNDPRTVFYGRRKEDAPLQGVDDDAAKH